MFHCSIKEHVSYAQEKEKISHPGFQVALPAVHTWWRLCIVSFDAECPAGSCEYQVL